MASLLLDTNWSKGQNKLSDLICPYHRHNPQTQKSILVHVLDGFVIEESNIPLKKEYEEEENKADETAKRLSLAIDSNKENKADNIVVTPVDSCEDEDLHIPVIPTNCKYCGGPLPEERAYWGKRFCSKSCGKRYSVNCSYRVRRVLVRRSLQESKKRGRGRGLSSSVSQVFHRGVGRGFGRGIRRGFSRGGLARGQGRGVGRVCSRRVGRGYGRGSRGGPGRGRKVGMMTQQRLSESDSFEEMVNREEGRRLMRPLSIVVDGLDDMDIEEDLFDGVEPLMKYAGIPLVTWNSEQVADFVSSIPGCEKYAEHFRLEEIDGQALMLLNEDHLVNTLNLKLGPALKISSQIRAIKTQFGVRYRTKYLGSPL